MTRSAGNFLAMVQANPSIAAGICTFAVAFSLVAGNAIYGQSALHPVPLWATRAAENAAAARADVQQPATPNRQSVVRRLDPQVLGDIPVPFNRPEEIVPNSPSSPLVRDIQSALLTAGLYTGAIDGIAGRLTREAIERYERAHSLPQTGLPSAPLLSSIEDAAHKAAEKESARGEPRIEIVPVVPVAIRSPAQEPEPAGNVAQAALVARIQIGLINFGETRIDVDGVMGSRTAEAIREFQKRYDLPVNGEPSERVVDKLEQIGALKKS